jgi:imidazole glycerol-phosphate synthase subunit HisH
VSAARLTMIDLGVSNLRSVLSAFERVGARVSVAASPADLEAADAVVLPGVGAFGDGMESLRRQGLVDPLRRAVRERGQPVFGICLGMQLLAEEGEEHGRHEGLGLLPGRVARLPAVPGLRVPNMGWCDVAVRNASSPLFAAAPPAPCFYFAHSYHLQCAEAGDVAATVDFGSPLTAAVTRGALFGIQFHPEKSQAHGLDLLASFCRHVAGRG